VASQQAAQGWTYTILRSTAAAMSERDPRIDGAQALGNMGYELAPQK
jgi:hypothetical protein